MANEVNIYSPRYLAEVVRQAPPVRTYFRDTFFTNVKPFSTERVDIDLVKADRLVVMSKGKVIADGAPRAVFQQVEELKAVGLTVPEPTALLWELRQAGLDVSLDALSDEECAQELYQLLNQGVTP